MSLTAQSSRKGGRKRQEGDEKETEVVTAAKHLPIKTTDRSVALQLPSLERGCILTRLSPVAGKERAFALVPQGPGNSRSHDPLVGGWSSVAILVSRHTGYVTTPSEGEQVQLTERCRRSRR
jgi:hypothetical protein